MTENVSVTYPNANREPWNKGKLIGPKPPLRPKHVWAIRTKLQLEHRTRDLALFNLAIDSKLRGCDVVALRVEDVAPRGYALDRAIVRQRKTGVRSNLNSQSRRARPSTNTCERPVERPISGSLLAVATRPGISPLDSTPAF